MGLFGFRIARVRGKGLEPKLPSGSVALFRRKRRVECGDVVLVQHPELCWMVKRVRAVSREGRYALEGLSQHLDEGRGATSVAPECLRGVLVSRVI